MKNSRIDFHRSSVPIPVSNSAKGVNRSGIRVSRCSSRMEKEWRSAVTQSGTLSCADHAAGALTSSASQ